jgi:hypothetical protein
MLDRAAPTPGPEATPAPAAPAPASAERVSEQPAPAKSPLLDLYPEGAPAEPENEPENSDPASAEQSDPAAPAPAKADDTADENTISTVKDLIEHFELDPEFFNTLKIDVKVDRQTMAVPISDLIKSYQIGEAATKRLEDAKTKAQALTSDLATKQENLHASLSSAAKLIKQAEDVLEADVKKIDWEKLRAEDPAEYAALKDDIKERRAAVKALKDQGAQAWRDAVASAQAAQSGPNEEERAAYIAKEKDALLEAIPDWSDQTKAKAEVGQLVSYLTTDAKFTADEVKGAIDHRLLVLGRKAMLYDRLQDKTDAAKKKVAKIPKTMKPAAGAKPVAAAPASKSSGILKDMYG